MAKDYDLLIRMLERDEGYRGQPYKCTAGFVTIGIGRNLDANPMTLDEAKYLCRNDITYLENKLKKYDFFNKTDETRQYVLLNMAFNLGLNGLLKFSNMINAIVKKDYNLAAEEMLNSRWATQVKSRATRLAKVMQTGLIDEKYFYGD